MKNGTLKNKSKCSMGLEWQDFRSRLNYSIIVRVLVILLCILITSMLYLLSSEKIEICTTATCVRTSMKLLDYIDPNVDPCQDFYLFSCGSFLQNSDQTKNGIRTTEAAAEKDIQIKIKKMLEKPVQVDDRLAFQKAKQFYRACMNETQIEMEGLAWMRSIFKHIGGWPTLKGNRWKEDQFHWEDVMHTLRELGVNAELFFKVTVDPSRNDETQHLLAIHGVSYSPSRIDNNTRAMYLDYMVDIAQIFGADRNIARKDSNEVIDLLLKLAKEYEKSVKSNKTGLYDLYSISELQHRYPGISWKKYLSGMLYHAEHITDDDTVVVSEPLYLDSLIRILKTSSKRSLANFIAWHTLQHVINYLPAKILDRAYEYLGKLYGKIVKESRWMTCVQATRERMDSVVSAAFIEHYFGKKSKKDVEKMIQNLQVHLKIYLRRTYGLDDMVIEKFFNNAVDIGSYSNLVQIHLENEEYHKAEVYEDKLLQSVLNLDFISLNMKFGKLRKPVKENWLGESSFVTGIYVYYSTRENVMRFPAGIFGGVYYQHDRPKYMNYGSVGSLMAQEISHILMKGVPDSSMGIEELNQSLDSAEAEQILADLTGMKVAYNSYINWIQHNGVEPRLPGLEYSPHQLFWISSAIRYCAKYSPEVPENVSDGCRWSTPQSQVNGPLQHIDDFAKDFGCPVGSGMNPENDCFVR